MHMQFYNFYKILSKGSVTVLFQNNIFQTIFEMFYTLKSAFVLGLILLLSKSNNWDLICDFASLWSIVSMLCSISSCRHCSVAVYKYRALTVSTAACRSSTLCSRWALSLMAVSWEIWGDVQFKGNTHTLSGLKKAHLSPGIIALLPSEMTQFITVL